MGIAKMIFAFPFAIPCVPPAGGVSHYDEAGPTWPDRLETPWAYRPVPQASPLPLPGVRFPRMGVLVVGLWREDYRPRAGGATPYPDSADLGYGSVNLKPEGLFSGRAKLLLSRGVAHIGSLPYPRPRVDADLRCRIRISRQNGFNGFDQFAAR